MENFNEDTQRAKVAAGFKGSDFFKEGNQAPAMTVVSGVPMEVNQKFEEQPIPKMMPGDPWVVRYPNAKLSNQ